MAKIQKMPTVLLQQMLPTASHTLWQIRSGSFVFSFLTSVLPGTSPFFWEYKVSFIQTGHNCASASELRWSHEKHLSQKPKGITLQVAQQRPRNYSSLSKYTNLQLAAARGLLGQLQRSKLRPWQEERVQHHARCLLHGRLPSQGRLCSSTRLPRPPKELSSVRAPASCSGPVPCCVCMRNCPQVLTTYPYNASLTANPYHSTNKWCYVEKYISLLKR